MNVQNKSLESNEEVCTKGSFKKRPWIVFVIENAKMANLAYFWNPERSLLKGQKLIENAIRQN